jgi:hypothetical protein
MKIYSAQFKGTTTVSTGSNVSLTGSFTGSIAGIDINSTNTFTASTNSRLNSIETISASNISRISSLESFSSSIFTTNTFTSSTSARLNSIETITASNLSRLTSLESTSASVDTLNTTQNSRLTSLEIKTGSLATTGSNTFYGTQTISGTVYIQNDLIVQGSSCIQNITGSSLNIGTNIVSLNTATPSVRYAGMTVQDSGSSAGVTGSILWDSLCNRWMYSNPSTVGYSGGIIMNGPRAATLGTETTLTCNYIAKSGGGDHLYDSCIWEMSGSVGINNSSPGTSLQITTTCTAIDVLRINNGTQNLNLGVNSPDGGSYLYEYCAQALRFGTSGTERARIAANGVTCFYCPVIVCGGTNTFTTWTSAASDQPGLYSLICIGSSYAGLYNKMYGAAVDAGLFGQTTQCMGYVGTDGACSRGLLIGTYTSSPIFIGTANTLRMIINCNGYVGVGTKSPLSLLQLCGSTTNDQGLFVNTTGTGNDYYAIKVATGTSTDAFSVTNAARIGMGTSSPCTRLHISGPNNDCTGNFYAQLRIDATGTYPDTIAGIALNSTTCAQSHIRFMEAGDPKFQIRFNEGSSRSNKLSFYSFTTAVDLLKLDGATNVACFASSICSRDLYVTGNIGINNTSFFNSGVKMQICGANLYDGVVRFINACNQGDGNHGTLMIVNSKSYALENDASIGFAAMRADGSYPDPRASIGMKVEGNMEGGLFFATRNDSNYLERVRITKYGYMTKPYQPYFLVYNTGEQTLNADTKLALDGEVTDITNSYDTTNRRFTAPIGGRYLFTFTASVRSGGNHQYNAIYIQLNGGGTAHRWRGSATTETNDWMGITGSAIITLAAGDYIELFGYTDSSSITLQINESRFSGYLLG